jgi:uncharacterized protein with PIN domain
MALCPHCEESITTVDIERVMLQAPNLGTFDGVAYSCPHCDKVLSVGFDPARQMDEIVDRLRG